ncbi:hypothetical protein Tco_1437263 [Tanacetum coccineum]
MEKASLLTTRKHLFITTYYGVPPTKRLFKVAMLDPSPNLLVLGVDQRVFIGMITKFIKFIELNFSVITRGFDIKVCMLKVPFAKSTNHGVLSSRRATDPRVSSGNVYRNFLVLERSLEIGSQDLRDDAAPSRIFSFLSSKSQHRISWSKRFTALIFA